MWTLYRCYQCKTLHAFPSSRVDDGHNCPFCSAGFSAPMSKGTREELMNRYLPMQMICFLTEKQRSHPMPIKNDFLFSISQKEHDKIILEILSERCAELSVCDVTDKDLQIKLECLRMLYCKKVIDLREVEV